MASFQAKQGWKRPRKSENKSYPSVSFLHDAKYVILKKSKKIQNIKRYRYGYILSQKRMEKDVKLRK